MRTLIIYAFVLVGLTSCSKYQFVTINSDIAKSDKGDIIIENDTFAVKYSFSGDHGPVRIQIINRLAVPLYVKWNSSSLTKIVWPTSPSKPTLTASVESGPFTGDARMEYTRAENPEETVAIAGHAYGTSRSMMLRKAFFRVSTPDMKGGELNGDRIRSQYFDRQNTPLMFLSQLSYSTSKDFSNSGKVTHEFWVDEVFITMIKPDQVQRYHGREDMFYLKKASGAGVFLALIGFFVYIAASQATP
jgi:hypothetical protein